LALYQVERMTAHLEADARQALRQEHSVPLPRATVSKTGASPQELSARNVARLRRRHDRRSEEVDISSSVEVPAAERLVEKAPPKKTAALPTTG
jgi:hypothetical protein